ncbi:uncharacterized protein BXZ73DRAFT_98120 [Epithele typhae]|uniref:uncharacterized protein n=1 Tax=Epithele typhae TaxID=378194 RepID=UPI002007D927|nr:uncharacterized protein BXZ73DRAFT_98120 [Epithele typhae]KAH9941725.1 hypothetical protein BXZ73DRAFT_98120 [Epithele typhae]
MLGPFIFAAVAALPAFVAADFIPAGSGAHFINTQNTTLALKAQALEPGASLVMALVGDGSASDPTVLHPVLGSGVPTQIQTGGGFCITANGVEPEGATQTLVIAECSDDPKQLWVLNVDDPMTISNADGNCIALGRPAVSVPVVLDFCKEEVLSHELWNPIVA